MVSDLFHIANFTVFGDAGPHTLACIVGLVAQLDLTPIHVSMRRIGDVALVSIVQDGIEPIRAMVVAEKMRALALVDAVEVSFHAEPGTKERT